MNHVSSTCSNNNVSCVKPNSNHLLQQALFTMQFDHDAFCSFATPVHAGSVRHSDMSVWDTPVLLLEHLSSPHT